MDVVSSDLFTYIPETRTMVSESSTLLGNMGWGTLPKDLLIRSARTSQTESFPYVGTVKKDGEVLAWIFAKTIHNRGLVQVKVFND